jgi:quercetin dioxygenase-like cupin family protein
MNKLGITTCLMVVSIGVAVAKTKSETLLAAPDLKWSEIPKTDGVRVAPLMGDMNKGAHRVMLTFPAGTTHPLHTHAAEITMVVISGNFTYTPDGATEKTYGPGSYIVIPGGTKHTSGCAAGAPCVMFHEATAKFDIKFVK